MGRMIFDILETNIVVSVGAVFLRLFADRLRRRYGAAVFFSCAWLVLLVSFGVMSFFCCLLLLTANLFMGNYCAYQHNVYVLKHWKYGTFSNERNRNLHCYVDSCFLLIYFYSIIIENTILLYGSAQ